MSPETSFTWYIISCIAVFIGMAGIGQAAQQAFQKRRKSNKTNNYL